MSAALPSRARVRLWGVRGTCPSPGSHTVRYGGNTPCVEVRPAGDDIVVLDAGTGLRALGRALDADDDGRAVHLFISHRHLDHVVGLPHFSPLIARRRDVVFICADASVAEVHGLLDCLLAPPMFPVLNGITQRLEIRDGKSRAETAMPSGASVRMLAARHPGGAAVVTVSDDNGLLLAYAPDNELSYSSDDPQIAGWRAALVSSLRNVPVLIHDATYAEHELAAHAGWGHSSAEEATRFAVACNADLLLLFHHHPDRTDSELDQFVIACRALADSLGSSMRIEVAAEGTVFDVSPRAVSAA